MSPQSRHFLLLNLAHAYDHFFLLIYPTAVLVLGTAWDMAYGTALALGGSAFLTFALATLPVGWLGDRVSRTTLMSVFFLGIGVSSILTGLASGPFTLSLALGLLGVFAAIYHPIGTAMVVQAATRPGRALGINGVFGNLGVAAAPLVTGAIASALGWRMAFILPGVVAILTGLVFAFGPSRALERSATKPGSVPPATPRGAQVRVLIVVATSALFGGFVFNGTTVALPKVFEERLSTLTSDVAEIGLLASLVFAIACAAQIIVGTLLDRLGAKVLLIGIASSQAGLLMLAAFVEGWSMLLTAIPMMLFIFGAIPIGAWLISHHTDPAWRSRIYSAHFLLALGVSALAVPAIAGMHVWTGGFALTFALLAGCSALVALVACSLPGHVPALRAAPA